jgi:hypothetical protein
MKMKIINEFFNKISKKKQRKKNIKDNKVIVT